ncbi:MAG: 1-acyl-sn-glycerol-3-phosphate acyltransferase, partial [Acidobacteriota bacterium]
GASSLPRRGPVVLVANHANAFVDPWLLMAALERPLTATAKDTLRRNPIVALLIRALGVVTFHRREDGAVPSGEVDPNAAPLARCLGRLREGGVVLIFPEGKSHDGGRLLPFRTGAARLALAGDATIVPVGLVYGDKGRFRSAVRIRFGQPLDAVAWKSRFGADSRALSDELRGRVAGLLEAGADRPGGPRKSGFWTFEPLVAGAPAALWGALHLAPPMLATRAVVRRTARDHDHVATHAVMFGIPIFVAMLAAWGVATLTLLPATWATAYVVSVLYAAPVALRYRDRLDPSQQGDCHGFS